MFEITLNGVKKYMDATLILKSITFSVFSGEKIGIVGANGSGKTTILKLIAGLEPMNYWPGYPQTSSPGYDEGIICTPKDATIAYLEQIPMYHDNLKVMDVLNLAFEEVYEIENEMRSLEEKMKSLSDTDLDKVLSRYGQLTQLFEVKGGYEIHEKINKVCTGLKFDDKFLNQEFNLLSGGEKTTVILGKLLIDTPDILLLDEPTNHLDMDSVEWLEGFLKSYNGIVIIVSHDRYFLDNVVNKIVEIEDMEAKTYKGNYSSFVIQKEENMRIQFEQFREQQKKINSMEKAIKELRDWAIRADNNKFFRRAASMQIKLNKMEQIDKPAFEKENMRLRFKDTERSGKETIKAEGLSKRYDHKIIFRNADSLVKYGERVALIGPNGCGKTTFLRMLLGEELPDAGEVKLGASVMAAYLPQKITFHNEELMLIDCFREDILLMEGKAREYLSKFMFYGSSVFKKVKHLSGGERIRLKLAKLLYEEVNLLILDEPTNHLDIDSIETIEEALDDFKGTIFFISHDRYFINKMAERVIAIEDYAFKSYDGNYDYYKQIKDNLSASNQMPKNDKQEKAKAPQKVNEYNKSKDNESKDSKVDDSRKSKANESKNSKGDHNRKSNLDIEKIESKIEILENEIKELDFAMNVSGLDYMELNELFLRKEDLTKKLEEAMEMWVSI